ncbi:MAG: hypothetical protein IJM51_12060 [Clostridia bacterium]|nr:hypothetical protein [Clostridia bacterium]
MNSLNSSIRIGSYTLAMRACELLRQNGISCTLRKSSDSDGKYGCLYSVLVDSARQWTAEKILRNAGIMILP